MNIEILEVGDTILFGGKVPKKIKFITKYDDKEPLYTASFVQFDNGGLYWGDTMWQIAEKINALENL